MAKKNESEDLNSTLGVIVTIIFMVIGLLLGIWFGSFLVGILVVGCGIYFGIKTSSAEVLTPKRTLPPIYYPQDGSGDRTLNGTEYTCKIAGITHHASSNDFGGFVGVIYPDASNPYDSNAVGIYNEKGKLLGYIPSGDLGEFREWATRYPLPCIGYIREGNNADIYGRIKVIDGDRNITEIHMIKYAIWMIENFGAEAIPDRFMAACPHKNMTTAQWLDYLGDELENRKILKKEHDKIARSNKN